MISVKCIYPWYVIFLMFILDVVMLIVRQNIFPSSETIYLAFNGNVFQCSVDAVVGEVVARQLPLRVSAKLKSCICKEKEI